MRYTGYDRALIEERTRRRQRDREAAEARADYVTLFAIVLMSLIIATAVTAFMVSEAAEPVIGPEPQRIPNRESSVVAEPEAVHGSGTTPSRRGEALEVR